MAIFHPFPRLPLELRQRIWEISAQQPRELPMQYAVDDEQTPKRIRHWYSPTKAPALLYTCAESRSHLQSNIYSRAFKTGSHPRYTWVNFEVDTIRIPQELLRSIVDEWNPIRHLALECKSFNFFWDHYLVDLRAFIITGLNTLAIIDTGGPKGRVNDGWWEAWTHNLMVDFYYRCDPYPFYTSVVAPSDPNGVEVNSRDYVRQFRAYRKASEAAAPPDERPDYSDESDSDDGRERWFGPWRHTDSCTCINRS